MQRLRTTSAVALVLSMTPAAAFAQHELTDNPEPRKHGDHSRQSDESIMAGRNREFLYTGDDPLDLQPLDQGPEGFRAGTPALQRADVNVALVDGEELRRRRLAMYEGTERFDAPVPVTRPATRTTSRDDQTPEQPGTQTDEPQSKESGSHGKYAFVGLFAMACGLVVTFFLRRR